MKKSTENLITTYTIAIIAVFLTGYMATKSLQVNLPLDTGTWEIFINYLLVAPFVLVLTIPFYLFLTGENKNKNK